MNQMPLLNDKMKEDHVESLCSLPHWTCSTAALQLKIVAGQPSAPRGAMLRAGWCRVPCQIQAKMCQNVDGGV